MGDGPGVVHGPLRERFAADLSRLVPGDARLGIAVSGGADSLALLLLAEAAGPGRIEAATVDHGLRAAAVAEADAVASACAARAIRHETLRATVAPGNVQREARTARYALLADWASRRALSHVATAHQLDDVAESFLMRAGRGAGVGGLARMRATRPLGPGVMLVRPLLGWRRAELAAIVAAAGLTPADDPSNHDPRFDRARARALLATTPDLDPTRLARAAAALADADAALAWQADRAWHDRATRVGGAIRFDPSDLPRETLRRLTARALATLTGDGEEPRGLDHLVDTLRDAGAATLAGVQAAGGRVWTFRVAPPRRSH